MHSARNTAMDLLSRRDHSRRELSAKLQSRGFTEDEIAGSLDQLEGDKLLDDIRFAEDYVTLRANKGFGPIRIEHELRERGIDDNQCGEVIRETGETWTERLHRVREKKFGANIPQDYAQKMKQARFLQNRGFSPDAVMRLFRS